MESDEEYMSENILKISEKEDKNISRKTLREIKLYKKAKEENFKNSKRGRKVLAEEKRNEIMGTKIKEDNIGYKMLEKMGYKAGSAIGKKGLPFKIILRERIS
uniref:G patch domain-containing protein 11 (Trinotate prediction) n=1 Tax=Henneguya salminicola TaxID=69463 RepID=A0A6G3MIY8_HENSL